MPRSKRSCGPEYLLYFISTYEYFITVGNNAGTRTTNTKLKYKLVERKRQYYSSRDNFVLRTRAPLLPSKYFATGSFEAPCRAVAVFTWDREKPYFNSETPRIYKVEFKRPRAWSYSYARFRVEWLQGRILIECWGLGALF